MKTIWKFPLAVIDEQRVTMPCGAKLLAVQDQGGMMCLWAMVDTEAAKVTRAIRIYVTGNPIPDDAGLHVDTVQDGRFVWHVFDTGER